MSVRRAGAAPKFPDNPVFVEFPRTDGDSSTWPRNTERIVSAGQVNYMRSAPIDDPLNNRWRMNIAQEIAKATNMPPNPDYVLKDYPEGYHMFDHNKGPKDDPRHDSYLYGSKYVAKFRSSNEFIPHAIWLYTDPTMNRANCACKYCTKTPQLEISKKMGLPVPRRSDFDSPGPSVVRKTREKRQREARGPNAPKSTKPYAAVRRAPMPAARPPSKKAVGPKQTVLPERDEDVRAALKNTPIRPARWFREGELVWCYLKHPIRGPSGHEDDVIIFWPGLVEEANLKVQPTPREPEIHGGDVEMVGSSGGPGAPLPSISSAPSTAPEVNWTVHQWTVYNVKLLATPSLHSISDQEALPYLAYAPSESLLGGVREELNNTMESTSVQGLFYNYDTIFSFDPYDQPPDGNDGPDEVSRFKKAAAPYTLAVQIASALARFWTPTDEWDCMFTISPLHPQPHPPPQEGQSNLSATLSAAMASNAKQGPNPPSMSGPPGTSHEEIKAFSANLLGQHNAPLSVARTVHQLRYQGLWWGAERIWADELVRIKLARRQFVPNGGPTIYPASGGSKSAIEYANKTTDDVIDPQLLGASEKGLFMRIDGLFVADVPTPNGLVQECRVTGMLYELAEDDWEDPAASKLPEAPEKNKGKGKERARDEDVVAPFATAPGSASRPATPKIVNISGGPSVSQPQVDGISALDPSLVPSAISNPDPAVPPSKTVSATLSQIGQPAPTPGRRERTVGGQISHPIQPYPLPTPPLGFQFRPILPPGNEVVLSLSLISGRYYPGLFQHTLLRGTLQKALYRPSESGGIFENRHIWAMEGLLPGVYQAMDPADWKADRQIMFKHADEQAREELISIWEQSEKERQLTAGGGENGEGSGQPIVSEDVEMEDLFGPNININATRSASESVEV